MVWINDIERLTLRNRYFRRVLATGPHQQVVLMSLPPASDIGLEVHPHTDQFFRIERGHGRLDFGHNRRQISSRFFKAGAAILIPAGTWHNIVNTSLSQPLQLYTLYAPPHHSPGTKLVSKPRT